MPFIDGADFEVWREDPFGRVVGFRTERAAASEDRYRAFEGEFRGPRARVKSLVECYLGALEPALGPVLEIGSGRGEFVELLRAANFVVRGSDPDDGMVRAAAAAGVNLEHRDARAALAASADGSLGAVFASHVIEHLPYGELLDVLADAHRALRPGGRLIAETVNPHAAHALKTFWVDLTHQHPIFPEVALALARSTGFRRAYVTFPGASGDVDADRFEHSSWALVATR